MATPTPKQCYESDRIVRLATPNDLAFIIELQKTWRDSLGFLTKRALAAYVNRHQCIVIEHRSQLCGYLNWNCHRKGLLRVSQIAVHDELLRSKVGSTIHRFLEIAARKAECGMMRAVPRGDLFANEFFADQHYVATGVFHQANRHHIPHVEWTRSLTMEPRLAIIAAKQRARCKIKHTPPIAKLDPAYLNRLTPLTHEYVVPGRNVY